MNKQLLIVIASEKVSIVKLDKNLTDGKNSNNQVDIVGQLNDMVYQYARKCRETKANICLVSYFWL